MLFRSNEKNAIYAYSTKSCTIYQINIIDLTWPYIDYVYNPLTTESSDYINLITTKSFVMCISVVEEKLSFYQIYNKFPYEGQAFVDTITNLSDNILNIHVFDYTNDTLLEITSSAIRVVKLNPRIIEFSMFNNSFHEYKNYDIQINANNSECSFNYSVNVSILENYLNGNYMN